MRRKLAFTNINALEKLETSVFRINLVSGLSDITYIWGNYDSSNYVDCWWVLPTNLFR